MPPTAGYTPTTASTVGWLFGYPPSVLVTDQQLNKTHQSELTLDLGKPHSFPRTWALSIAVGMFIYLVMVNDTQINQQWLQMVKDGL